MDTSLDRAALLVTDLLERVGSSLDEVVGVGIALPAPVDAATGMISVRGMMSGWDEIHIGHVLSKRLGCPVFVDNDANLGALAESVQGAARFYRDSVFVRASYGTGAGHRPRRPGARGLRGHGRRDRARAGRPRRATLPVRQPGLPRHRGRRGRAHRSRCASTHGTLTLRDVVQGAIEGDPGCARVIADAGSTIGVVVAGLAIALNPQVHRGRRRAGRDRRAAARRRCGRRSGNGSCPTRSLRSRSCAAELGERAEVIGALESVFRSTDFVARSATIGAARERVGGGQLTHATERRLHYR